MPRSGVRPTKDMVRQALFSAIGGSIVGKRVADLFAGSGIIGLEAVSRGADSLVWVESDARTHALLEANVSEMCGEGSGRFSCRRSDVLAWLASPVDRDAFDLMVADPPYGTGAPGKEGAQAEWTKSLLAALSKSGRLKPQGLFVLEQRASQPVVDNDALSVVKEGKYGETRLVYYRTASSLQDAEPTL